LGTALGLLLLGHAAFSCWHYRTSLLILLEEADETTSIADNAATPTDWKSPPPVDVIWELVIAFVLCLLTQIGPSTLRPVGLVKSSSSSSKTKKTNITTRTKAPLYQSREFDLYATRAKALAVATATATKSKRT
jgi:hypothetical protein